MSCIYGQKVWKYKCLYTTYEESIGLWKIFSENVKYKARFFDHKEFRVREYLNKFSSFFQVITITNYPKAIYRARVIDSEATKLLIKNGNKSLQLGKTPKEYAKNNRFSAVGISYGYYSFDEPTILHEIRANKSDEIAIGKFKLNDNLKILDFRKNHLQKYMNPFNDDFSIDVHCDENFILDFLVEISKPISEKDSLLEYVPTQILSEYIWSLGYDAFIFDSSLKQNGENLVIFGNNPKCTKCKFIKIKEKNINYDY